MYLKILNEVTIYRKTLPEEYNNDQYEVTTGKESFKKWLIRAVHKLPMLVGATSLFAHYLTDDDNIAMKLAKILGANVLALSTMYYLDRKNKYNITKKDIKKIKEINDKALEDGDTAYDLFTGEEVE